MAMSQNIRNLVAVAAPYWAGEAEVARTYFNSPQRTAQTDTVWLARQCFKEFWGSGVSQWDKGGVFLGSLKNLVAAMPTIDVSLGRADVLDILEGIHAEFSHYCAFADAYDAIRAPDQPKMDPHWVKPWGEEDKLTALRYEHQKAHGTVGLRACKFTEGGYCAIFSEGMALAGRSKIDDLIAKACSLVYEDEFSHMLAGVAGIDQEGLAAADWKLMEKLVIEQLQQRIRMRNEMFSFPMSDERMQAVFRGEITPVRFDYDKAKLAA